MYSIKKTLTFKEGKHALTPNKPYYKMIIFE